MLEAYARGLYLLMQFCIMCHLILFNLELQIDGFSAPFSSQVATVAPGSRLVFDSTQNSPDKSFLHAHGEEGRRWLRRLEELEVGNEME